MGQILALGDYADWDRDALEAEGAVFADHAGRVAGLDEGLRRTVRVVAFQGHHPFTGDEMDLLPELGLIANFGVGYDSIDVAAAAARGIRVTNTPGVLNDDVADLAVALLLAQSRQLVQGADWVRSGRWETGESLPLNRKVSGRRVGIMGLGRIGREVADRLAAFKMQVHYHSRGPKEVPAGWTYHADPVALAAAVDDMVVTLVGGPETEGYVDAAALAALGPDGVIVNVSRGSVIDEPALIAALENGTIRGAGLDVFRDEPRIDPRFRSLPNVLATPHQGSGTIETRKAMGQLQRDNIAAFLAGEALKTPVA